MAPWHRCKWKMFKEKSSPAQRPTTSGSSCSQALKRLGRSEQAFPALAVPRLHEKVRNLIPKMLMQACPDERQFFHAPSDAMDPKHGWIHQSCQAQAMPNCMFLRQEANNWCSRFRHHFRTQQSHAHPVKQACDMPDPFRSDVLKPHADQIGVKFAVIWLAFALCMQRAALQLGHSESQLLEFQIPCSAREKWISGKFWNPFARKCLLRDEAGENNNNDTSWRTRQIPEPQETKTVKNYCCCKK